MLDSGTRYVPVKCQDIVDWDLTDKLYDEVRHLGETQDGLVAGNPLLIPGGGYDQRGYQVLYL